jgi:alpha-L-fucosidase
MSEQTQLTAEEQDRARRLKWFREARFGMFIHWGLYAQLGRHEWVMNRERIPIADYEKLADSWKPKPNAAREWAKLAKNSGMRYMVMTTKHHEGFCLFNSELTDYCATKRGPGRDLVAEFVSAARNEGLKVGFYYSMMDWHHPDGARCKNDEAARRRFVDYIHGQVRELCTNYGRLDVMWYDVSWPLDAEGWESAKMNAMVRQLQPDILINDRSQLPEDFGTPENEMRPAKDGRAWEACSTFNESWGYTPIDKRYKDAWSVHHMLRQVASGGGNLLLNIGPTPSGGVPEPCKQTLREVGDWMGKYGTSIYDATDPMEQEWLITGSFTRKGNTLFFHCDRWPGTELAIGGLQCTIKSVKIMGGWEVGFTQTADRLVIRGLPQEAPDPICTVLELQFEGDPAQKLGAGHVLL